MCFTTTAARIKVNSLRRWHHHPIVLPRTRPTAPISFRKLFPARAVKSLRIGGMIRFEQNLVHAPRVRAASCAEVGILQQVDGVPVHA